MAEQRTKEIGVRKVLGASVFNLWKLLSKRVCGAGGRITGYCYSPLILSHAQLAAELPVPYFGSLVDLCCCGYRCIVHHPAYRELSGY